MPICPDKDNQIQKDADSHIRAHRAVLQRLDQRINEMEEELKVVAEDSPRSKLLKDAIADLRLEIRGQKLDPDTGKYVQVKEPGSVRAEIMESLYTERPGKLFIYENAEGKSRKATIHGLPSIQEMREAGFKEAVEEMVVRSLSLITTGDSSRNPYDYLNTEGLEVKSPLDRIIEHHHIFNNVVLNEDGTVHPKSIGFRFDPSTNKLSLHVIPAYHGYEYSNSTPGQMDSVQFICLMDAMHSGDDAVCHLHYYQFNEEESRTLKEKAVQKSREKVADAKAKFPLLEGELNTLLERQRDPNRYEQELTDNLQQLQERMSPYLKEDGKLKPLKKGSAEAIEREDVQDQLKIVKKDLDKHHNAENLRAELTEAEENFSEKKKTIQEIKNKVSHIKKRLKEGKEIKPEQKELLAYYEELLTSRIRAEADVNKLFAALEKEGTIETQITRKQQQIKEAELYSNLTDEAVEKMFEESNGFFSFEKGTQEKTAHETFRPKMNEEITKNVAREALEYLNRPGSEDIDSLYTREYQRNLNNRLAGLASRFLP